MNNERSIKEPKLHKFYPLMGKTSNALMGQVAGARMERQGNGHLLSISQTSHRARDVHAHAPIVLVYLGMNFKF